MGRINLPLGAPPILADPATPSVAAQGTGGAETWGYAIVGVDAFGQKSDVTAEAQEAAGNAVLDDQNFNRVTWTDIAGYVRYEIWRETSPNGASDEGLIGYAGAGAEAFDDIGYVVDGDAPAQSTANTTGIGWERDLALIEGDAEVTLVGIGTGTYEVQSSHDRAAWVISGVALTADGARTIAAGDGRWVRVRCTAFTAGTPNAFLEGNATS